MATMVQYLFYFFTISILLLGSRSTESFLLLRDNIYYSPIRIRQSSPVALRLTAKSSDNEGDSNSNVPPSMPADLSWLKKAMDNPISPQPDGLVVVETQPGISGFAIDPDLGFVVVLVGNGAADRATYAIVSPKDKERIRSAEALCLVQLAGGLDLGTPVLPPDMLAKLVADSDEVEGEQDARQLRPLVELLRVDVVPNDNKEPEVQREKRRDPNENENNPAAHSSSTLERDASIESQAPKVFAAVSTLPGLLDCTQEQVIQAMKVHANDCGTLDRPSFDAFLDTLRRTVNATEPSKVKFMLVVSIDNYNNDDDNGDNDKMELTIPAPSTVAAIGLALRYKVDVVVSEECQMEGFDVVEIASRFPAFRPIKELYQDAKIMDGFIPSMFNQAAAPPDNEDKV